MAETFRARDEGNGPVVTYKTMKRSEKIIALLSFVAAFFCAASVRYARADAPTYAPNYLHAAAVSASQVNLAWDAVTSATGYRIDRETPVGGGFTTIATFQGALSYSDMGLSPGTTYNYRVAAVNSEGTGPFSDSATNSVTTLGAPAVAAVPSAPSNLTATGVAGGMNLSWTATQSDAPITGYRIERDVGGGFSLLVPNTGSAATTYSDSGLSLGVTYGYKVSALSSAGPSNPSPIAYGTVPMPPNAPPTATAVAGDGTAAVSWLPSPLTAGGITGYMVAVGNSTISVSLGNVVSTTITGLMNGTSYFFLVNAVNAAGQGFTTKTNTVIPTAAPVVPPPSPPVSPSLSSPAPTPEPTPEPTPAPSVQSLQEQLNALIAQLQVLQRKAGSVPSPAPSPPPSAPSHGGGTSPSVAPPTAFSRDLDLGSRGADVKALQEFLIEQNKGTVAEQLSAVGATGYFGPLTRKALAEYQENIGISPAVGYLGSKTRNYINTPKNR